MNKIHLFFIILISLILLIQCETNDKNILEDDEKYYALCNKAKQELENCKNNYNDLIKKEDLKNIIFEIYKEI